jgi:hypothetical protein
MLPNQNPPFVPENAVPVSINLDTMYGKTGNDFWNTVDSMRSPEPDRTPINKKHANFVGRLSAFPTNAAS